MKVESDIAIIRKEIKLAKDEGKSVAFVPTMGALHKGHMSLVKKASEKADYVVMSIFVNPIQFDNKDDLVNYPSTLQEDIEKAQEAGVSLIFTPTDSIMYHNQLTFVDVEELTNHLCGSSREGHFRGVFTVVSKLFNIVQPDYAVFGQKDIQQALSICKMVNDLNFPVEIVLAPTVREDDGLALSSRNKHLSSDERKKGLSLYNSLTIADELIRSGERSLNRITEVMATSIEKAGATKIDYISAVDFETLQPVSDLNTSAVIALAVYFGTTRLIDNIIIRKTGGDTFSCEF